MEIMTVREAAKKWELSERRVTEIIRSGRIEGVYKIGTAWVMPADTQKPLDNRFNPRNKPDQKQETKGTILEVSEGEQ